MMVTATETPDSAEALVKIRSIANQYIQSCCLLVATRLGVADVLATKGPLTVDALAQDVGANANLLGRLLRALASIGIFAEDGNGRYAMTPLSDVLRRDHPKSARNIVLLAGDDWSWASWGQLMDGVQTGETPFTKLHHTPYYEYQQSDPER